MRVRTDFLSACTLVGLFTVACTSGPGTPGSTGQPAGSDLSGGTSTKKRATTDKTGSTPAPAASGTASGLGTNGASGGPPSRPATDACSAMADSNACNRCCFAATGGAPPPRPSSGDPNGLTKCICDAVTAVCSPQCARVYCQGAAADGSDQGACDSCDPHASDACVAGGTDSCAADPACAAGRECAVEAMCDDKPGGPGANE